MLVKLSAAVSLASISTPKTKIVIPTPLMCLLVDYAKRFRLRLSRLFAGRGIVWYLSKRPNQEGAMHRLFSSLRWRLLLGTALWVLASLLVVGTVVWYVFKEQTESQLRSELSVHLNQLSAALEWQDEVSLADGASAAPQVVLSGRLSEPRFEQPLSGWYWQVTIPEYGSPWSARSAQSLQWRYESALEAASVWYEICPLLPMRGISEWWSGVCSIDDGPLSVLQQRLRLVAEDAPELLLPMDANETVLPGPL